jgi:hypothetical protein
MFNHWDDIPCTLIEPYYAKRRNGKCISKRCSLMSGFLHAHELYCLSGPSPLATGDLNVPLPIAGEIYRLTALQCQMGHAVYGSLP